MRPCGPPPGLWRLRPAGPRNVRPACLTDAVQLPPAVSYSLRRIGLFMAVLGLSVVTLHGLSPILVLMVATVVSGGLSYFLLAGTREQMARSVAGRVRRVNERLDAGAAKEDAALDAAEGSKQKKPE